MSSTPMASRRAVRAGDAPTDEARRGKEQVLALQCKRTAAKTTVHFFILTVTCLSQWSRGHNHHRLQEKTSNIQVEREKESLHTNAEITCSCGRALRESRSEKTKCTTNDTLLAKFWITGVLGLRLTQLKAPDDVSAETSSTGFLCFKQFTRRSG